MHFNYFFKGTLISFDFSLSSVRVSKFPGLPAVIVNDFVQLVPPVPQGTI